MQPVKIFQVDAFTDALFSGNPAAVCILESWLDDAIMQSIANENNLAETAFIMKHENIFEIRWFTPTVEVDLCGHATVASAFVLFHFFDVNSSVLQFHSHRSGQLSVEKKDEMLYLNFPTDYLTEFTEELKDTLETCIGVKPLEIYKGKTDYLAVIENEELLNKLQPDFFSIAKLPSRGLIVTAKGEKVDFVSRFFAPQSGIDEDPVTGSAHTSLTPLWSKKLGKNKMVAHQLSKRGGQLFCENKNDRCLIGGNAKLFLTGEIYLE